VKPLCGWSVSQFASQGASQGRSFLAMAFDLARPGVAPQLETELTCNLAHNVQMDVSVLSVIFNDFCSVL